MRKIALLLIAAAGVSLSGAATAADLGTAPIYRKAPPVVNYLWQGSYIGLYAGGAVADKDAVTVGGPNVVSYDLRSSFIGGYTGGYNWQLSPNWVIGYESETGYIKLKGSANFAAVPTSTAITNIDGAYSAWTARLGYAWDRSLIYAKGGIALTQIQTGVSDPTPGAHIDTRQSKYKVGYAVGAGWEYALDQKWSIKAEYLYLGFEKNYTTNGLFNVTTPISSTTSIPGIHTGKVGVNYKFDWFSLLR